MKMYILEHGKIVMSANDKVTGGSSDGTAAAIPVHSFLFDTNKGWVLFDNGCDPQGMTGHWPEHMRANPYIAGDDGAITEQLALLGLTTDDIHCVVMSHLHLDHAGSLSLFPNAEIYVNQEEFTKTLHAYADRDFSGFHMKSDIESWLRAELAWRLLPPEKKTYELCDDLTILNFGPGHSYGMLGLLAKLPQSGSFLLAADAIYTKEHFGPPAKLAGIAYDEDGYFATIEAIRALAKEQQATILFGHDMAQFQTLKKAKEGCYL